MREGMSARSGRRGEGRESSRTIGGGKEKREKRATSPGERGRREGGLFIGHTSERKRAGENQRVRDRACTYFMGQDFMTV